MSSDYYDTTMSFRVGPQNVGVDQTVLLVNNDFTVQVSWAMGSIRVNTLSE